MADHGRNIRLLFKESDGRALLERAFAADPKRTTIELAYLGAEDVAGDLKLEAERRAKQQPSASDRPLHGTGRFSGATEQY